MTNKIAIIHTTSVTVDSLKQLIAEKIPNSEVINFVDDSVLPQLQENDGKISLVEERLVQYAKYAEELGADIILNACSSVGEVVSSMRKQVDIPVVRIDEAMAEMAIQKGTKIGVAATLATTLRPTMNLIETKAKEMNKEIELISVLAEEAYQFLLDKDQAAHDCSLADSLMKLEKDVDIVVLAQASMARVVSTLDADKQGKFLSSPTLGVERVRQTLEEEQ